MIRGLVAGCSAMVLLLRLIPSEVAAAEWPPRDGLRVVFLGDSITQAGLYVRYVDAYLLARFPDRRVEVIGLGLASETVSGNTEPGHPYPRPDIRTRLARALKLTKPDLVFVCYGMNDGLYTPPDPARTELYRKGIEAVVDSVKQAGAEVIVGTPPPFDSRPIRAKTAPLSAPVFGYQHPYVDYDGVLGIYTNALLDFNDKRRTVADIHGATRDALTALRVNDPTFTFATDGIHPGADGHWLIARSFLEAWGAAATPEVDAAAIDAKNRAVIRGNVELVASPEGDNSFRLRWTTKIPLPRDPGWDARVVALERIDERFNRHRLLIVGLPDPRYAIYENDQNVGEVTREQLADGLDLLRFPRLSTNRRSAEVWSMVQQKHNILRPSWLEAVGHGPPLFGKTLPIDAAKAKAAPIEEKIRDLTRPAPVSLRLVPIAG